jgi:hypothetical protein
VFTTQKYRRGRFVNNDTKAFLMLVGTGAMVALGKLLSSDEKFSLRLYVGRIITGSATSLVAGLLLLQIPDIAPIALLAAGSALGIAGSQMVEVFMRRWFGGAGNKT